MLLSSVVQMYTWLCCLIAVLLPGLTRGRGGGGLKAGLLVERFLIRGSPLSVLALQGPSSFLGPTPNL